MAYTAGVATDVHHTLARVTCTKCGFQGWEDEVCTYLINSNDLQEMNAARQACKNKTQKPLRMTSHPVPPAFVSAA